MAFFAMPYRVLFQDTMAYGSHHFLTNFKFQCAVREHFFFGRIIDRHPDDSALRDLVLLTQEGYTRNLAPVRVGEQVGVLLSIEDNTRSSMRMCFRVVKSDGVPVCAGFQTVFCASARTGEVTLVPDSALFALSALRERLWGPSFQERVLAGGKALKSIFDDEAIRLATGVVSEGGPRHAPPILMPPESADNAGVVLTFPGQGSWEPKLFHEIRRIDASVPALLAQADEVVRRLLGEGVSSLASGNAVAADAALSRCPDLVQVLSYITSVLCGRRLLACGVKPRLLLGHSAGELSALAVAGVFDFLTGIELVCRRVLALQGIRDMTGGMLAVPCDERKVRAFIDEAGGGSLEISVVNHDSQSVVSGTADDLRRLASVLSAKQVTSFPLKSKYPFHSQLLKEAVAPFRTALQALPYKPLTIPVYSPMERGLLEASPNLAEMLPAHFVHHLYFSTALEDAVALGGRTFIECGGGRVLTGLVKQVLRGRPGIAAEAVSTSEGKTGELDRLARAFGNGPPAATAVVEPTVPEVGSESPVPMPIAVVALGCILPGASDPDSLWANLLAGKCGIIDVAKLDPVLAADFRCDRPVKPDKSYSMLNGRAYPTGDGAASAQYTADEWKKLPTVGKFLAEATAQCLTVLKTPLPPSNRVVCVLGSTGDGSVDYDEVLLLSSAEESVRNAGVSEAGKDSFFKAMEAALGRTLAEAGERMPHRTYSHVARRLLGDGVKVLAVDAACASSLYAIDLGMRALRDAQCDVAFCGGAFAPGVANTCLFAQFQGLSATGSKPLDAGAGGVVFGEGASLLVLKRLPDALAAGDRIVAVIRGVGTSSDGKSPSVMEPRKEGQVLAMRRAAARCNVPPSTVQYIDAHATGTPVGDAVEFASLCEAVGPRPEGRPPIRLGSLKALLGHTGWAAGASSVIALCKAIEHRTFPPQPNFSTPNPHFGLEKSPFTIGTEPTPWPPNLDGLPRRAGVNGFGFGGCDAHLILEEFMPEHHRALCAAASAAPAEAEGAAVVAFTVLLPASRDGGPWVFSPAEVKLPPKVRILPDVADHMDRSHILAVKAGAEIAGRLSQGWDNLFVHADHRPETGILMGFAGKTRRGIDASLRVYFDYLKRRLREVRSASGAADPAFDAAQAEFVKAVERITPSGPYTLPGLMPNVGAGRVANAFHLTGPNMVLDADQASLFEALREGERLLRFGECKIVLAGGIGSCTGPDVDRVLQACAGPDPRPAGEAVIVLALVSPATAREAEMPVLAHLSFSTPKRPLPPERVFKVGVKAPVRLMGAEGAVELAEVLELIRREGGSASLEWTDPTSRRPLVLNIAGSAPVAPTPRTVETPAAEPLPPEVTELLAVPIRWTAPQWVRRELPASGPPRRLDGLRALILTDRPEWCLSPDVKSALGKMAYRLVCPTRNAVPGAIAIDPTSAATVEQSLKQLADVPYDNVLVLMNLDGTDPLSSAMSSEQRNGGLLDLLYAVSQHAYPRLEKGGVRLGALCLGGVVSDTGLHPSSGLLSGFARSLSRELPQMVCKLVNVPSTIGVAAGLDLLAAELGQGPLPATPEVSYFGERRHESALMEIEKPFEGALPLTTESVVMATGGARGITAVLAEAFLRRFGCTLVLVGRTDPANIPADLIDLDDEAFERFEQEFFKRELAKAKEKGEVVRMPDLKLLYDRYRSAREAAANLKALGALPGKVRYLRADVTDEAGIDAAIARVAKELGRLDMVVHGAGIQTSKVLARKKIEEFRAILTTKLGGLGNLMRACKKHFPGRRIHFHPVTSAFSQIGNAGQEDYGAANIAMDRIAQHLSRSGGPWDGSSLGWLGWFKVGMTRGSEYSTLAVMRRLRPIPRAEGETLFETFLSGRAASPTLHLMSDLEAKAFQLTINPEENLAPRRTESTVTMSPDTHGFLKDHLLNGTATMPGAFAVELAVRTVQALRPALRVVSLDDISIERFVKFPEGKPFALRAVSDVLQENATGARIRVRFLSDFVHANGKVLQKDIVHFSAELTMSASPPELIGRGTLPPVRDGWHLPDPYLHPAGPLLMDGLFRSIADIRIGPKHSKGIFRPRDVPMDREIAESIVPFVMLDAIWRFSAVVRDAEGSAVLCVPLRCGKIEPAPGVNHRTLVGQDIVLTSSAPRIEGEQILVEWSEAVDASGRVLLKVHNIVGQIYGKVPAQAEPLSAATVETPLNGHAPKKVVPVVVEVDPAKPFAGKVSLVTGSGRGIGKAIARRLAALGAQVIVNSFHSRDKGEQTTEEILASGGKAVHLWGSVANSGHLTRIFQEIGERFGGLDHFVSNAAAGVFAPLPEVTAEHWERAFRTNIVALHQGSLLAAELMRKRGGGRIVAMSSVGAMYCFQKFGCVGPVKAALERLASYLGQELAADGIEVSTVTAGPVEGELLDAHPGHPPWERLVPRGKLLSEDEVADAVIHLLAHGGMNGNSLVIDAAGSLRMCESVYPS